MFSSPCRNFRGRSSPRAGCLTQRSGLNRILFPLTREKNDTAGDDAVFVGRLSPEKGLEDAYSAPGGNFACVSPSGFLAMARNVRNWNEWRPI